MEAISLSSKGLCVMTRIARKFAVKEGFSIRLSEPDALVRLIKACEQSDDPEILSYYDELHAEIKRGSDASDKPFTFSLKNRGSTTFYRSYEPVQEVGF